jgi:hypothetical protein
MLGKWSIEEAENSKDVVWSCLVASVPEDGTALQTLRPQVRFHDQLALLPASEWPTLLRAFAESSEYAPSIFSRPSCTLEIARE